MNEKSLMPAIRFAGFADAWERRKVEELATRVSSIGEQTGRPRVEYEDIISGMGQLNKDIFTKVSNKPGIEFSDGDVLYGKLRPYLKNWLLPNFNGLAVGDFWVLHPQNVDSKFLFRLIQSRKFEEVANQSVGTKMPRADWKLVSKTDFGTPLSLSEQRKVGSFFETLDTLITLHQRKHEKLLNIKKSMLDKIFPKDGELSPEVRFAGFTAAWERRKLGEIAEKFMGGGTPQTANASYWNGEIPWFQSSDIREGSLSVVQPNKYISHAGLHNSAAQLIPANSIAIVVRVGVGKLALVPFSYATSQDFVSLCNLVAYPEFCVYAIYHKLQGELKTVQGTAIKGITKDDLLSKYITVARDENEQKQIGIFFSSLDNLITLHQRKLEKLQNIKKACLEKMFV